jgi:hypothetical protein
MLNLILPHGVKQRERIFSSGQTDENSISFFDHFKLFDGLQERPKDVLARRPPPALDFQGLGRVRSPAFG